MVCHVKYILEPLGIKEVSHILMENLDLFR